jgi:predicted enzyme related to lactoylglutathione lyase
MSSGYFVWHDLYAYEPEKAPDFYRQLFGWDVETMPAGDGGGDYTIARHDGEGVGGIGKTTPEQSDHCYWNVYLSTEDFDATLERITANGGEIVNPGWEIPGVGRMAFAKDNTGAEFSPFQNAGTLPEPVWPPKNPTGGAVVWHDHMSDDPAAAAAFYGKVFDVEIHDWSEPGFICWGMQKNGATVGVILQKPSPDVPTCWTTYIESPKPIDELIQQVDELGGTAITPKMHHPNFGDFVVIEDPAKGVISAVVSEMWRG